MLRVISEHEEENVYYHGLHDQMNPLGRMNLGFRKNNKLKMRRESKREHNDSSKELRFSSLSKNKDQSYGSGTKLEYKRQVQSGGNKENDSSIRNRVMDFGTVRRRLNFETPSSSRPTSSEKLSFGEIVQRSRDKSLRGRSGTKESAEGKLKKPPIVKSGGKVFNKLKNRLIGDPDNYRKSWLKGAGEEDMVKMSTDLRGEYHAGELDMSPVL